MPLAEVWNGSTWQIQATPVLPGATQHSLSAVSCTSATRCVAVGAVTKGSRDLSFAERWDGHHWSLLTPPSPPKGTRSEFNGVSCTSATRCVAVGDSTKGSQTSALAEVWNGSKWAVQQTPDRPQGKDSQLDSVSCTSASACMAGGDGLAERWNGKKWSLETIPSPHGGTDLVGVSCVRAGVCYGVGFFFIDGVENSTAEFWNGSSWSVAAVPITTSEDSSGLSAVSCTTAQDCTAVGFYHDPVNGNRALAEDFALRWQDVSPPPLNDVFSADLSAVSCAAPRACVAVGTFEQASGFDAFSEAWNGSIWSTALLPQAKISNAAGISCTGPNSCIAVGDLLVGGLPVVKAWRWNGVGWVAQRVPRPASAARSFLLAVSCTSSSACTAVGESVGRKGKQATLAERWNGKTWTIQRTPDPGGTSLSTELGSVSCGSATSCVAVGASALGRLVVRWNGKTWAAQSVPVPKGGSGGFLFDVSCTSASACTMVGDFSHRSKILPLADRWNGKSWTSQNVPASVSPTGLATVSCVNASSCFAAGFQNGSDFVAFGEHWNGKKWGRQPMQLPAGALSTTPADLSCNSDRACMAVGSYTDSSSNDQMLAEQYS